MEQPALRVAKNAPGPFYVRANECLICYLCVEEAPDLMTGGDTAEDCDCYFTRQPQTPEEIERALRAIEFCCIQAVAYDGDDPTILARIAQLKAEEDQRHQERLRTSSQENAKSNGETVEKQS